jgi:hypothetical protein
VPLVLPAIPINLFWSVRFHRDPANQWLRTLMVDTFNIEEQARRACCGREPRRLDISAPTPRADMPHTLSRAHTKQDT